MKINLNIELKEGWYLDSLIRTNVKPKGKEEFIEYSCHLLIDMPDGSSRRSIGRGSTIELSIKNAINNTNNIK